MHLGQHGDAFSNCQAIFAPRVQSEFLFSCASALAKHVGLLDQLLSPYMGFGLFSLQYQCISLYILRFAEVVFPEMRMGSKALSLLDQVCCGLA